MCSLPKLINVRQYASLHCCAKLTVNVAVPAVDNHTRDGGGPRHRCCMRRQCHHRALSPSKRCPPAINWREIPEVAEQRRENVIPPVQQNVAAGSSAMSTLSPADQTHLPIATICPAILPEGAESPMSMILHVLVAKLYSHMSLRISTRLTTPPKTNTRDSDMAW